MSLIGRLNSLDIGLTLEYLEAHAVPVAGYQTSDWPAFYTAVSGFKVPMRLESATEVAETIGATASLLHISREPADRPTHQP